MLAAERRVRITEKARREVEALDLGLDAEDVCELLAALDEDEFHARLLSTATDEWMYVFRPMVAGVALYVKIVVRADCVVVSFHEDEDDEDQEDA
jgi:hypothetical protein